MQMQSIRVPRIKTGDPNKDLYCLLIWFANRDFVHGTYRQYRSAKYFFASKEEEFDGVNADYYFEAVGLNRSACYREAKKLRRLKYSRRKEPARIYRCKETCSDGKLCNMEFVTFEEYRKHLGSYNHNRRLCARPGCNEVAKIRYCSSMCYTMNKKGKPKIERFPIYD